MPKDFKTEYDQIIKDYKTETTPRQDIFKEINKNDNPIVVFGCGWCGKHYFQLLLNHGYGDRLQGFCDNTVRGYDALSNKDIILPEDLAKNYRNATIVIGIGSPQTRNEVLQQLIGLGLNTENIISNFHLYQLDLEELEQHYEGYSWAYDFFDDEISKNVILNRIRGYLFNAPQPHYPPKEQYFSEDAITLSDDEVFVDCGHFTGDTTLIFIEKTKGQFKQVYGFEPEYENWLQAKQNLANYPNVESVNMGVFDKDKTVSFFTGFGGVSRVDNIGDGNTELTVTSLDSFFETATHKPTLIKMDIEGVEREALIGAEKIIKKYKPKLAICVYHKPGDIYELPRLIQTFGTDYKFTLRHYYSSNSETVMYGVPV